MKKAIPFIAAGILFLIGLALASGLALAGKTQKVVVAAHDLPAGHTLMDGDLTVAKVSNAPEGAYTDPAAAVGQTLAVPRMAGDVITANTLGGLPDIAQQLAPNERAVAVKVSLSSGIAGLLEPGDRVGVTMVLNGSGGTAYAKATVENLRVIYVSPDFQAPAPAEKTEDDTGMGAGLNAQASEGVVVLAVPIAAQAIVYDFSDLGLPVETRNVNAVELLSALDQSTAKLSLYLTPAQAQPLMSSGLLLPDLVIIPDVTPTPTPTPMP